MGFSAAEIQFAFLVKFCVVYNLFEESCWAVKLLQTLILEYFNEFSMKLRKAKRANFEFIKAQHDSPCDSAIICRNFSLLC